MHEDHRPKYFLRTSMSLPRYRLRIYSQGPPFLRISSSSAVQRSLASLVSMQLSKATRSPDSWSSLSVRVFTETLTILEQSFRTSLSSRQLEGIFLSLEPLEDFSCFLDSASWPAGRCLFLSCPSLGSLSWIFISPLSKMRNPSTPSFSIQLTIFFISFSSIMQRQSWQRLLRLSAVLWTRLLFEISSKVLIEICWWWESCSRSSRSSCSRQLSFLELTSKGFLEDKAFLMNSLQVISAVFLRRGTSGSREDWGADFLVSMSWREPTT